MKLKKILSWTFVLVVLYFLFTLILLPSYYSTKAACFPSEDSNIVTVGETNINETTDEIIITLYEQADKLTLKHEYIHYNQISRNPKTLYCGVFGIRRYIIELEAYTNSYLPDFIYIPIYGDYKNIAC